MVDEENEVAIVEEVLGGYAAQLMSDVEELPYVLTMGAIFGKDFDLKKILAAREILLNVLENTASELRSITRQDLLEQRLEHLESLVRKNE